MNAFTTTSAAWGRALAFITLLSLLLSAFPAGFFVAEAASTLSGPASATLKEPSQDRYESIAINASAYENLIFSFDYNAQALDSTGDSFSYGWNTGSGDQVLGTVNGLAGDAVAEIDSVSVALPVGAQAAGLKVFVLLNADTNGNGDKLELTNITVTGDPVAEEPEVVEYVDICHATNANENANNPFNLLNVNVNGLNGHDNDDDDIIPAGVPGFPNGQNLDTDYGDGVTGADILENDCEVPEDEDEEENDDSFDLVVTKIVCEDESLLPDGGYEYIGADTAQDFLDALSDEDEDKCYYQSGWEFQFAPGTIVAPDNGATPLGEPWMTISPTGSEDDGEGTIAYQVLMEDLGQANAISVREVLQDGYLPFSGSNEETESPVLYCASDVGGYDNLEWISGIEAGETYHCVAWNVAPPQLETIEVCKYVAEVPRAGWDMVVTNGETTYEVTTEEDGCVEVEVNVNNGPWRVTEDVPAGWAQAAVEAYGGESYYLPQSQIQGCIFAEEKPEYEAVASVAAYDYEEGANRCAFYNREVPVCVDQLNGDWADTVEEYEQELRKNGTAITDPLRTNPATTTGPADWVSGGSSGFFSLGFGGYVVVSFDNYVPNVPGNDLTIYEATNGNYPTESAKIEISQDGDVWYLVGIATNTPPSRTASFDIATTGLAWFKYVKVTDTTAPGPLEATADGFDLDAVRATESRCDEPETPGRCVVKVVSDESNTVVEKGGAFAKAVTFIHNAWDAVVGGGSLWIWGDDPVANPSAETIQTFENNFGWNGPVTSAILTIAADNSYEVSVNSDVFGGDASENNFATADVHDLTDLINQGNNTLSVMVKNFAQANGTTESNPAGLKYELVVTGTDEDCDIPYVPVPKTATVTMCKVDGETERSLSGWQLMLQGDEVASLSVPANTPDGVNSPVLSSTTNYLALASGTWNNNRNPVNPADAEYSTENGWTTQYDGFPGYGEDILDLQVGEAFVDWGSYSPLHQYVHGFMPATDGAVNFRIFDGEGDAPNPGWYGDNSGSLTVDLFEGYVGETNENGCVVFEDVPYGTYEVAEVMKEGWENVSGLGEVVVDSKTETFTVTNRQIPEEPEYVTVVAHKIVCTDESELPDWAHYGDNTISSTTAADWVAEHESCALEPNWQFQWALPGVSNPDNNLSGEDAEPFYGAAGAGWNTFGPTDVNGQTTLQLDAEDLGEANYLWVREVLKDDYLPFTYGPDNMSNADDESAEIYCHNDVRNYDNFDRIDGIDFGDTYYCVAWNHIEDDEEPLTCDPKLNLLANGGFEAPELPEDGYGWDVYESVSNGLAWVVEWLFPSEDAPETPLLELQGGYFTASEGVQYAELDSNYNPAPGGAYNGEQAGVRILQTIPTVPGYEYTVSYDFSPKPGYDADSNVLVAKLDGTTKGTHSADGTELSDTDWNTYSYSFVATDEEVTVSFEDAGTQDTFGTLIDDVSARCVGRDDDDDEDDEDQYFTLTVAITGEGSGGVTGGGEGGIQCSTLGGESNDCSQVYPAGTVVNLSAIPYEGSNFDNSWTVGAGTCTGNNTPCAVTMNANVDLTAHFDLNGDDDSTVTRTGRRGGGGGGTPRVLGESTPTPMVLGEQVTAVPYGAPDTGAGGAAPVAGLTLLALLYTGSRRTEVVKK